MNADKSYEYVNDYLFFVLKPDTERGRGAFNYCSGVNVDRFLPITRGRHRPMSNPAVRGLQLVNLGVRSLVLSQGATPTAVRGKDCSEITPAVDAWSTERLLIENAHDALPDEIIKYAVMELLKKIDRAIMLEAELPDTLLSPGELQVFIDSMCNKYGR